MLIPLLTVIIILGVWFRVKIYIRNRLSFVGIQHLASNKDYIKVNYIILHLLTYFYLA